LNSWESPENLITDAQKHSKRGARQFRLWRSEVGLMSPCLLPFCSLRFASISSGRVIEVMNLFSAAG
jgi:hypothetical protein